MSSVDNVSFKTRNKIPFTSLILIMDILQIS